MGWVWARVIKRQRQEPGARQQGDWRGISSRRKSRPGQLPTPRLPEASLAFSLLETWRGCGHLLPGRQDEEVLSGPQTGRGGQQEACLLPAPSTRPAPAVSACGLARPRWDEGRSFSSEGSPPSLLTSSPQRHLGRKAKEATSIYAARDTVLGVTSPAPPPCSKCLRTWRRREDAISGSERSYIPLGSSALIVPQGNWVLELWTPCLVKGTVPSGAM